MTNAEIGQWVDNDKGLYRWWKGSRLSKREFIKEHKQDLIAAITAVVSGKLPAHFLYCTAMRTCRVVSARPGTRRSKKKAGPSRRTRQA